MRFVIRTPRLPGRIVSVVQVESERVVRQPRFGKRFILTIQTCRPGGDHQRRLRDHAVKRASGGHPGGSFVFLVETGESRTPRPKELAQDLLQA